MPRALQITDILPGRKWWRQLHADTVTTLGVVHLSGTERLIVIYENADGRLLAHYLDDFLAGRFVPLDTIPLRVVAEDADSNDPA